MASDEFNLTIFGKGSHGSMPHLGIDPIVIGAEIVNALQTIVSRNATPGEMTVVTIGRFQSGTANNVIADQARLRCDDPYYIRCHEKNDRGEG